MNQFEFLLLTMAGLLMEGVMFQNSLLRGFRVAEHPLEARVRQGATRRLSIYWNGMGTGIGRFYDDFAANYHLLFEDWEASIIRQAAAIASILERECAAAGTTVLDCACGIGTQALGLAKLGFCVTGADVSAGAIDRARSEATARKLKIPFYIAAMRNLGEVPAAGFDAVICMDNALPHLHSEEDLMQAAGQIRAKLRIGGTFVASIRDYDEILAYHPVSQGPALYSDKGERRIVFQVWDWHDDRRYTFHMYITRETSAGWTNFHGAVGVSRRLA